MTSHWTHLDALDPERRDLWGGKACGLARLLRAGARVPPGLALAVGAPPPARWHAGERADLLATLAPWLRHGPLAVRSSARAEDGAERSFAGIYETLLDLTDAEAALAAVERCRASGGSARARAYGGGDGADVGVVVQRQVEALASGVLFTRDPLGRDGGATLEAVAGIGEALVAGHTEPARWRAWRAGTGRIEAACESAPEGHRPLPVGEVVRVAHEGLALAATLGEPLDLEWALAADGTLWWLQARPITALREPPPAPEIRPSCPGARDGPVVVWTNLNVRETMPDPLTPLAWSLWRDRMIPAMTSLQLDLRPGTGGVRARQLGLADLVDGRVYWNVNAALGIPGFRRALEQMLGTVDGAAAAAFEELRARGVLFARRHPMGRATLLLRALRAQLRGLPALARALRPGASLRALEAFAASLALRGRAPLAGRSDVSLLRELDEITTPAFMDVRRVFSTLLLAMGAFQLARHLFRAWPEAQAMLGVGIRDNPTTRISLGIEELARSAAPLRVAFLETEGSAELLRRLAESDEGRAWLERLDRFLDENGQRGPGEFDLERPRWSDDPTMVLGLVRSELREPAKEGIDARLVRLGAAREAALAAAVARAPRWKRPLLRAVARAAERHLPLREAGKHHLLHVLLRARRLLVELGARLAQRGALAAPEDVFLLELDELSDAVHGHLQGTALRRRLERARRTHARQCERQPPAFVRSDGVPVRAAREGAVASDGALLGTGVGAGTARGRVRILHAPDPEALSPGEILVVRLADPGWTPLFPRAGGLVMEVGGLMCHAAVVARELGVPAVFGVAGATSALADGDLVEVDSLAGAVRRL